MYKVLVVKTEEDWNERRKRWFDVELDSETRLTDVKYVCVYSGNGTGGATDRGGYLLRVKEWLVSEDGGQPQRSIGIGAYSFQSGQILYQWGLINEGMFDPELGSYKSLDRLAEESKWIEIPVGQRVNNFDNLAIDLETAKESIRKFYGVKAGQVSIRIQS